MVTHGLKQFIAVAAFCKSENKILLKISHDNIIVGTHLTNNNNNNTRTLYRYFNLTLRAWCQRLNRGILGIDTNRYNSHNECRLIHSTARVNNYFNRFTDECVQWNESKKHHLYGLPSSP